MKYLCIGIILFLLGIAFGASYVGIRLNKIIEQKVKDSEKFRCMYRLTERWMRIKDKQGNLADYFNNYRYKKIAIYGMAELGQHLVKELENSGLEIAYGIDKNVNVSSKITILSLDDDLPIVDVIVVTAVAYFDEIEGELSKKTNAKVISLEDIIYEV